MMEAIYKALLTALTATILGAGVVLVFGAVIGL